MYSSLRYFNLILSTILRLRYVATAFVSRVRRAKRENPLHKKVRYYAIAIAVVIAQSGIIPLNHQKASAWSGNLPSCTISGGAFSWAWKDRVQELLGINVDSYNGSTIIMKRLNDADVNTPIQVWFSQNVELNQASPTNRRFIFNGGDGAVNIGNNPSQPSTWQQINSTTAPFSSNVTIDDVTCIDTYRAYDGNPVYENDYTGIYYGTTVPDQVGPTCDTLDITCRIASIFQGVQNTFASVGQFIVRGIANIFIPETAVIQTEFNRMFTFINEKLGFLIYPATFLADFIDAFNSPNNWCTSSTCAKTFGNLWGSPFTLDFYVMKNSIPDQWNLLVNILRGMTVFALMTAVYRKLMSTLRGQEA